MRKLLYFTLIISLLIFGCNSNNNKTNTVTNIENNKLLINDTLTKKIKRSYKVNKQNEFTNEQIDTIKNKLQFNKKNTLDTLFRLNSAAIVAVKVFQEEDNSGAEECIYTIYWFYTLDKNLNVLNQIKMDEYCDYEDGGNNFYYRILCDTLLEIQQNSDNYNSESDYDGPKWKYFSIDNQGNLTELKSNRRYPFTKFVEMNEMHPFVNYIIDVGFPGDNGEVPSHGILELHHGFTLYELDYMRNEIFADYGYKFKTDKWLKVFSKQKWYKPLFDNVDDSLTTIEKKNIAFILKKKNELENENK